MDLMQFLAILAATPVLSEVDKNRHREDAPGYSPALRERMAAIIAEEEAALVEIHIANRVNSRSRAMRAMEEARIFEAHEREMEKHEAVLQAESAFC
jgi:hypothetical protein